MEESVNVLKFAEARAGEIASMMEDINYKRNKTAFQRLPPHMRRRAASHNPKRVPRKLRDSFLVQNPHATVKTKKIHQKQRRKNHEKQKTNFPQEYASRSHGGMWLETNVWHSKKFKMEKKFEYKLPISSNDKKLGATHKAMTEAAMLVDLSYYCCIALEGPEKQLCEHLSCLTNKTAVSHFASEKYKDGKFEGHAFLYHPNSFPYEAIGPVTFMWRPNDLFNDSVDLADSNDIVRKLWIWCHPSFYDELVKVLISIFKLNGSNISYTSNTTAVRTDGKNDVERPECEEDKGEINNDNLCQIVFASKVNFEKVKVKFQKKEVYTAGDVKMSLLKDKLNRFRIIGPNAYSILSNILELGNVDSNAAPKKTITNFNIKVPNGDLNESLSSSVLVNGKFEIDTKEHKRKLYAHAKNDICYSTSKKLKLNSENIKFNEYKLNKSNSVNTKSAINGVHDNEILSHLELSSIEKTSKMTTSEFISSDHKQWWQSYYTNESRVLHSKRENLIDCLQNRFLNYYIPSGSIFGLTVRDPRLVSRHKQKKFVPEIDSSIGIGKFDEIFASEMASSPLWDENICNEVTATQISEDEINKERSKYVVSSVSLNFGNRESRVPILLIHQKSTDGFASGFDIIVPLGWGMAFWIPLVLNGGRAAGLRDLNFINLEIGQPSFPLSCPDTNAGRMYEEECRVEELTVYYKRPKAKRPNFSTFGTPNPFYMPWEVLIKDWKNEVGDLGCDILFPNLTSKKPDVSWENFSLMIDGKDSFFVLRQKEIQELLNLFTLLNKVSKKNNEAHKGLESLKQDYNDFIVSTIGTHKEFVNSYVLVKIKCKGRGCPTKHSGIYMPSDCDIIEIKKVPNFLGPIELNHNANKNANKIDDSLSTVTNEESCDKNTKKSSESCKEESKNEKNFAKNQINARNLKRPEVLNLKACCSRKMVGYLSEGGFSSISGKGCGIGHCSFIGLLIMLKSCINSRVAPYVLIREQHSFQYRVCSIEIIKNYL